MDWPAQTADCLDTLVCDGTFDVVDHSAQNLHFSFVRLPMRQVLCRCMPRVCLIAVSCVAIATAAQAQAVVVLGRVRGPDSSAVVGAIVTVVSLPDSGISRNATDSLGNYEIRVRTQSNRFRVVVTQPGFAAARREIERQPLDTALRVDFAMTRLVQTLAPVKTRATRPRPLRSDQTGDFGPGQAGRLSAANTVDRADGLTGDMTGGLSLALAMLANTGVVWSGVGDPSISAFGMGADQNLVTLNGMTLASQAQSEGSGLGLPRDGFRLEAVPATYDPAVGGFAGLLLSLRFPAGGDIADRTAHYSLDRPELAWTTRAGTDLGWRYGQQVVSGTASGAFSRASFYNLSYQADQRISDAASLKTASSAALSGFGLSVDSAARLQTIASQIGIPAFQQSQQRARSAEAIARFDYRPQERPQTEVADQGFSPADNQMALVLNGSLVSSSTAAGPLSSPGLGTKNDAWTGGALGTISSFLFGSVLNELSVAASITNGSDSPSSDLPGASVLVTSTLPDGRTGVTSLQVAGNGSGLSDRRTAFGQIKNQTAWYSWDRVHLTKLSVEASITDFRSDLIPGSGSYAFASLDALQTGLATEFSRTLTTVTTQGQSFSGAIGISDIFAPRSARGSQGPLEIQFGLRAEARQYHVPRTENRAIDSLFGTRTDRVPSGWAALPMIGFSRSVGSFTRSPNSPPAPRGVLFGGIREYQGDVPASSVGETLRHNGLSTGVQQVDCVGADVPAPNWKAFQASSASVPRGCADSSGASTTASIEPSVVAFADAYQPARSWRAALGLSGVISQRLSGAISATYALNTHLADGIDENFNPVERFDLSSEGGRPVFVNASDIVPSTGAILPSASRRRAEFGPVLERRSDLRGRSGDLTVMLVDASGPGQIPGRRSWRETLAYTFSEGSTQINGFSGGATASDPRVTEWVRSPRSIHKVTLGLTLGLPRIATIASSGVAFSGNRFTPRVVGDINGDGLANDRAFVPDPRRSVDSALGAEMTTLLSSGSVRGRACLEQYLNRIAPVNACTGPWSFLLNLSLAPDPYRIHLGNRGTLRLIATNVLGGADAFLHGHDHLHGWGPTALPDANLLFVRGFSPTDRRFLYTVNQNFGRTSNGSVPLPARLTLDLRIYLGPDRETEFIRSYLEPQNGNGRLTLEEIRNQLALQLYSALDQTLALKNSLRLADWQTDSITAVRDRYRAQRTPVMAELASYLGSRDGDYSGEEVRRHWHDAIAVDSRAMHSAWSAVRHILTADQYAKLSPALTAYWDLSPDQFEYSLRRPLALVHY